MVNEKPKLKRGCKDCWERSRELVRAKKAPSLDNSCPECHLIPIMESNLVYPIDTGPLTAIGSENCLAWPRNWDPLDSGTRCVKVVESFLTHCPNSWGIFGAPFVRVRELPCTFLTGNCIHVEFSYDSISWIPYREEQSPETFDGCNLSVDYLLCEINCSREEFIDCCCECMSECTDLIAEVTQIKNSIMCLSDKIECLIEVFGQSQLSRVFVAQHYSNMERILVANTNQISQALMAIAQGVSEVEIPIPSLPDETIVDPSDNSPLGCGGGIIDWCGSVNPPS